MVYGIPKKDSITMQCCLEHSFYAFDKNHVLVKIGAFQRIPTERVLWSQRPTSLLVDSDNLR